MGESELHQLKLSGHAAALRNASRGAASRLRINPDKLSWFSGADISLPVRRQLALPKDPALRPAYADRVFFYGEGEDSNGVRRSFGDVRAATKEPAPGGYQANWQAAVLPYAVRYLTLNSHGITVESQTVAPFDEKLAMMEATENTDGTMESTYREVYRFNPVERGLDILTGQQFKSPHGEIITRTRWVNAFELPKEISERVVDRVTETVGATTTVFERLYKKHPTVQIVQRR